jgi:hypothetical protein
MAGNQVRDRDGFGHWVGENTSELTCPCGARFVWEGFSDDLHPWREQHRPHLPAAPAALPPAPPPPVSSSKLRASLEAVREARSDHDDYEAPAVERTQYALCTDLLSTPDVLLAMEALEALGAAQEAADVTESVVNDASRRYYAARHAVPRNEDLYDAWVRTGNANAMAHEALDRALTGVRIIARRLHAVRMKEHTS